MQLPKPSLRIVEDKPGECLALESDAVSVPPALRALVTGLVGSVARIAGVVHADQWWRTLRLRADRAAGTLVVDDIQILDNEERSETIALAEISLVTVRTRHVPPMKGRDKSPPFGPAHPRHVEILVSVGERGPATHARRLHFAIEGMDTLEKVADLAYRLGAVLDLHHQRIVRRDPRRIEIEMAAMAGAGLQDLPRPEAPSDYTRDFVFPGAEQAAAGPTRLGAVDPAHFPGDSRITRWSPGDEVRFDTPAQGLAFGCVPMATGSFLLGPAVWYLLHDVALTVTLGVVGILVGAVAVFG
ncbi:MAG TPA: hypothetical protein VGQ33_16925, partial [Vicinamibacteria bacterium]|nr:hypothetical protein [Vicinamibacteria bacterium]